MASDKVKVAVRVRPINRREIELGTKVIVDMQDNQTVLRPPNERQGKNGKVFAFDHCFMSMEENHPKFAGQEHVFECVGSDILERAFEGYNGCIFAYGQTGSGKSYTMMGSASQKGLIPRLCDRLFEHIAQSSHEELCCKVAVSYMEIYNERVHDLLDPKGSQQSLKVREHNILGPYVDGLSLLAVKSFEDIDNLMSEGNKSRTVAVTNMNSESSRSHAVFNIVVTQTLLDTASGVCGEKVSKLSLVDLAGSERAQKTGAVGERLKEGSNINKSLTTLGLVISALADQSGGQAKRGTKFVPYRDSVLTWLLKDSLGGNSKTVMVATISPAADNYEETLSTLRYADRAKRIVNHAVINEDPNARIIRELREEVEALRQQLSAAQSMKAPELQDRLWESEKLMKEMTKTWEEKLAETEKVHMERHKALEQMGVSVQRSGIRLDNACPYLVNLNADPSLNELLVYYLKDHTLVGRPQAQTQQDIQLSGLGIMPQHAIVDVASNEVFITPLDGARTCVNGSIIRERQKVKHGDRIVWGNNHFFRLNCPKPSSSPQSPDSEEQQQRLGYDFAQQELMEKELGNDPVQEAIGAIEKQHEEDKQEALEKQRQMYERQMQMLRNQLMSPGTPSFPLQLFDAQRFTPATTTTTTTNSIQRKYQQWAQDREKNFKQSLANLREEVVKANALVREANFLAQEMGKLTQFRVTLQIPAANLSPNRRRGTFVSKPAISVKRGNRSGQIWTMEKLENKVIDMRDMYEERKAQGLPMMDEGPPQTGDPFYESQENHNLIGVANIFLECLFHDVKLDYHVPIISQQGEVAGKLHVEISKVGGAILDRYVDLAAEGNHGEITVPMGAPLLIQVCIQEARGLPPALAHFVFCQYNFWGQSESVVVPPEINPDHVDHRQGDTMSFTFNHQKVFRVPITEEFIEFCADGALSIEVWGHRSHALSQMVTVADAAQAKSRSVADRWSEVMRKIEMWVEFHELNDQGEYTPVEVISKPDVPCAGVFQLRQGHSRRVLVRVKPVANSGTLPLICECVSSLHIGCLALRSKLQKGLDSYQEEDLTILRDRWSVALARRKHYLDEQIQKLIHKPDKTEADSERERALIEQWVCLTEERNAVLVPSPGSNIPGAPADWHPPPNVEEHSPVLFLDLNADDMSVPNTREGLQAVGVNSILPKEHTGQFVTLPVIKYFTDVDNVCAIGAWDSSLHDSASLNRLTGVNERLYMVVKVVVRLSHPASMELVLRKRVAINIYKKQGLISLTSMLKNRIYGSDYLTESGIIYELVSNLPKGSEELEDLESLAQMAASHNDSAAVDGETYIEKYIKGISAVESILTLDRLRQEVAVKEMRTMSGLPRSLRKTISVPNINQFLTSSNGSLQQQAQQTRSDSVHDLSLEDQASCKSRNFTATPKVPSPLGPGSGKVVKPMMTLLEEQHHREIKPLLNHDTEEEDEDEVGIQPVTGLTQGQVDNGLSNTDGDDYQEFESYQSQQMKDKGGKELTSATVTSVCGTVVTPSSTTDSLADVTGRGYAPSIVSSGYGSQAVSTLTLSSDDTASVKSVEEPADSAARTCPGVVTAKRSAGPPVAIDSGIHDINSAGHATNQLIKEEAIEEGRDVGSQGQKNEVASSSGNVMEKSKANSEKNAAEFAENSTMNDSRDSLEVFASDDDPAYNMTTVKDRGLDCSVIGHFRSQSLPESQLRNLQTNEDHLLMSNTTSAYILGEGGFDGIDSSLEDLEDSSFGLHTTDEVETPRRHGQQSGERTFTKMIKSRSSIIASSANSKPTNTKAKGEKTLGKQRHDVFGPKMSSMDKKGSWAKGKRWGSGMRPRPKSTMVSPKTEQMTRAWQDDVNIRSNLHLSHDSLPAIEDNVSECSFGSRADLDRLLDGPLPVWVKEGEGVMVTSTNGPSKMGTVRFMGPVAFAPGNWVGVELDQPEGKNDGSVKGIRYFHCRSRHGIFVRPDKVVWDKKRRGSSTRAKAVQGVVTVGPSRAASAVCPSSSKSAKK